jgi:pyruvate,water dikinase
LRSGNTIFEYGYPVALIISGGSAQGTVDPDEYQIYKPLLSDPALVPIIEKTIGARLLARTYP